MYDATAAETLAIGASAREKKKRPTNGTHWRRNGKKKLKFRCRCQQNKNLSCTVISSFFFFSFDACYWGGRWNTQVRQVQQHFFSSFIVVLLFYGLCFHMLQIGFWIFSRKKKKCIHLSTSNGAPQPHSWVRKEKVHTELKKKKTRKMINTGIPTQKGVLNAPPPKKKGFFQLSVTTHV